MLCAYKYILASSVEHQSTDPMPLSKETLSVGPGAKLHNADSMINTILKGSHWIGLAFNLNIIINLAD